MIHGNNDTTGAVRSVEKIVTGLQWAAIAPVLEVTGTVGKDHREAAHDLGGTLAATLSAG